MSEKASDRFVFCVRTSDPKRMVVLDHASGTATLQKNDLGEGDFCYHPAPGDMSIARAAAEMAGLRLKGQKGAMVQVRPDGQRAVRRPMLQEIT